MVQQPAEELLAIPSDVDPLSLEANTLACGLFPPAGCPFANRCYSISGELITASPRKSEVREEMSNIVALAPTAPKPEKPIGTLYVDAWPVIGVERVEHAGPLIAKAAQSVCDDAHVLHSQLVEYGKGAHMLAAQLAHDIRTSDAHIAHLYLETRSAEGKACFFELSQLSERVVRGMI
jgi:hypothetical protein